MRFLGQNDTLDPMLSGEWLKYTADTNELHSISNFDFRERSAAGAGQRGKKSPIEFCVDPTKNLNVCAIWRA